MTSWRRFPRRPDRLVAALAVPAFLLLATYFAHFSGSDRMGLYEDDHAFAVPVMSWRAADLGRWCWQQVRRYPMPQGRPVGFALGTALPWVGYHYLGGLPGAYFVGYAAVGANVLLVHGLLRRATPEPVPLVGAVAFALFPADTTRPFLCHATILAPAVTFTLLACHGWLATHPFSGGPEGRAVPWGDDARPSGPPLNGVVIRVATYAAAAVALLTYETAVLPFVAVPLLARRWDRAWGRAFAVHLAVVAGLFAALAVSRRVGGESRAVDAVASPAAVVRDIARGTVVGTATVARQAIGRWAQGGREMARLVRPFAWPAGVLLAAAVVLTVRPGPPDGVALLHGLAFAAAAGAIGYALSFTHAPWDFAEGRMTSTHLAMTVPFAVLVGVLAAAPVWAARALRWPPVAGSAVAAAVAAGYLAPLFAYAQDVQDGYAGVWRDRQQFWRDVIDRCPDLAPGTTILCDGAVNPPARYIAANSWSDSLVPPQLFALHPGPPRTNEADPLLCCFARTSDGRPTWQAALARDGDRVVWADPPFGRAKGDEVRPGTLVLLHVTELNDVTRDPAATVDVGGRPFPLHAPPPPWQTRPAFVTRPLYPILTGRRPVVDP